MDYLNSYRREGRGCQRPKVKGIGGIKHPIHVEGHLKIACSSNIGSVRRCIDMWAAGMCSHITMMVRDHGVVISTNYTTLAPGDHSSR